MKLIKARKWFCICYAVLAAAIFLYGTFGKDAEGGSWFILDFMYWPGSILTHYIRELAARLLSVEVLMGWPSERFSIMYFSYALFSIVGGTLWYYLVLTVLIKLNKVHSRKQGAPAD